MWSVPISCRCTRRRPTTRAVDQYAGEISGAKPGAKGKVLKPSGCANFKWLRWKRITIPPDPVTANNCAASLFYGQALVSGIAAPSAGIGD